MEWHELIEQLQEGIPKEKLKEYHKLLIESHYTRKAAGSFHVNQDLILTVPKAITIPLDAKSLEQLFVTGHEQMIYELSTILLRKNLPLPIYCISEAIQCAKKKPNLAEYILPILGEAGHYICEKIDRSDFLVPNRWSFYFENTAPSESLKWFGLWRKFQPTEAFAWLKNTSHSWDEKLKCKFFEQLITLESEEEQDFIIDQYIKAKSELSYICIELVSHKESSLIVEEIKFQYNQSIEEQKPIAQINIGGIVKKLNAEKLIASLQPSLIEENNIQICLFFCVKNNLLKAFQTAISKHKSEKIGIAYMKFLLEQNLLNEEQDLSKISSVFSYSTLNQFILQWIDKTGEQTNIETLLHFVLPYKHFWSDEFAEKIISVEHLPRIKKLYSMQVFYDQMLFKLNPNSKILPKLLERGIFENYYFLSPAKIIQFRKEMRLI